MDDARKKAIKLELRRAERQQFLRGIPLPAEGLMRLLVEVNDAIEESGCDRTFRQFEAICREQQVDPQSTIAWFREKGHDCDCEAVDNIIGRLEDALKEAPGPSIQ